MSVPQGKTSPDFVRVKQLLDGNAFVLIARFFRIEKPLKPQILQFLPIESAIFTREQRPSHMEYWNKNWFIYFIG